MEVLGKVLKEIGIVFLLIILVAAIAAILFVDKIPFSKQIPESINYKNIDKDEYNVRGDVEDTPIGTETYMSKTSELKYYEFIKYILPGRHRPFGSTDAGTDIPTEYVGKTEPVAENDYEDIEYQELEEGEGLSIREDPASAIQQSLQDQNLRRNRLKTSKKRRVMQNNLVSQKLWLVC